MHLFICLQPIVSTVILITVPNLFKEPIRYPITIITATLPIPIPRPDLEGVGYDRSNLSDLIANPVLTLPAVNGNGKGAGRSDAAGAGGTPNSQGRERYGWILIALEFNRRGVEAV